LWQERIRPAAGARESSEREEGPLEPTAFSEDSVASIRASLLRWYDSERRDLPWRRTRDPYAIWISEVMLQQTQVPRVAPYWERFLDRFPTAADLASASEDDVLAAWSGLGYYRRARFLHRAAGVVTERHGGRLPATARELAELPGMGDYTAAAVASIAFGEAVAVIDANVVRGLSRILGIRADPSRGEARRALRAAASALVDPERPGDFNQAMMELGSEICVPRSPRCAECPVSAFCAAIKSGHPERYPARRAAPKTTEVTEAVAVVSRRGRVLLAPADHERGWWKGLWIPPRGPMRACESAAGVLARQLSDRFGLECAFEGEPRTFRYSITRHRVRATVLEATLVRGRLSRSSGGRWFRPEELPGAAVPAPYRRVLPVS